MMAFKADGAKIRRWREERHWSQEHLSELAGIGLRTIQRIESGEKASLESVTAIAAAFNVEPLALSIDVTEEARKSDELKAAKSEAEMRQSFYIHAASFAMSVMIFGAVAVSSDDYSVLKVMVWWIIPLAAHGLTVFLTQMSDQNERKFSGK